MNCGIYKIEHCVSGRVYIGSAVNIRRRWHLHRYYLRRGKHHSSKLQRAWNKHGEDEFRFEIIFTCEPHLLLQEEQRILDDTDAARSGFNCNPNAANWLGRTHSKESRAKMSASRKGRPIGVGHLVSVETRAKIRNARLGQIPTERTRAKLRKSRIGKRPALGMKHTAEARALMSVTRKAMWQSLNPEQRAARTPYRPSFGGRRHSPETRERMSARHRGRSRSPETKAKIREALIAYHAARKQ